MKKLYLTVTSLFLLIGAGNAQNIITENFDDLSIMFASGWVQDNNSNPLGSEIWHNGNALAIPAFNGNPDSYAEASFQSTDANGTGTINNWLITPSIMLNDGDIVSFYATSFNNAAFPDRLEIRLNPANTTDVGTGDTTVGAFTNLLLSLNPNLLQDTTLFPQDYWGQFMVSVSGLGAPTMCRLAFRYFVVDGGGLGANSSTIGIDAFSVDGTVGVQDLTARQLALNVYPNPANNKLVIEMSSSLTENGNIRIVNVSGQVVKEYIVQAGQRKAVLDVNSLPAGTYAVAIETQGTSLHKTFVKVN